MIYNWFTSCWPVLAILQPRKWRTPRRSSPRCTAEVSLPPQLGGFQMAITTSRLCVQLGRPRMTPSVFFSIFWMNMLWWEKKTAWNICSLWFFFFGFDVFLDYFDGERADVSPCKNRFDLMDMMRNMRNMHSMALVLASSWIDITGCKTQQLTQSNHLFLASRMRI